MRKTLMLILISALSIGKVYSQHFDARCLQTINTQTSMHGFSTAISESTIYVAAAVPVVMGITSLATRNDALLKEALCTGVGLGLSVGLCMGMKYIINRPRPYDKFPDYIHNITSEDSPSFPSGHTTIAFSIATSLTLAYPRWYVALPSFLWASSVGYSRMNLGVHYPTDVLAGAVLGAGSAYLTFELNKLLWKKCNNKPLIGLKSYQTTP